MGKKSITEIISGKELCFETGVLAKQANGSVLVKYGNTVILATATMSKSEKTGIDYFPLMVEYAEKTYAAGKFPGGFFKRETKPSLTATLTSRLIDRPIRPAFPDGLYRDVQVVITVLSFDATVPIEWLAINAASAALSISDIPFNGPVGAALVCEVNGELKVNPSNEEVANNTLHLIVAGTKDAVLMIEAGAKEVSEARILEAIQLGHQQIKQLIQVQQKLVDQCQVQKQDVLDKTDYSAAILAVKSVVGNQIVENMKSGNKQEVDDFLSRLQEQVYQQCINQDQSNQKEVTYAFATLKKEGIRNAILQNKLRPDGRALNQIRPISVELDLLPSAHGSAVFTRGETQSLCVVTLGTTEDEQIEDGLLETKRHRYFYHYNFPPFSVGEVGFLGRIGRREYGHGALAQRALESSIPDYDKFPYTIRLVSEILESNGSSSMASVCSGSLAMMAAGIPIASPISGIAMGLLLDQNGYVVLSDIQGLEDHYGDMDFKVAGTKDGVTALQLDIKVAGLSEEILRSALAQAKEGRFHILEEMQTSISTSRQQLADTAPKIEFVYIDPDKVGALIGPGGKMIRKIEADTGTTVFVVDGEKGEVSISGVDPENMKRAVEIVRMLGKDLQKGDLVDCKVVRIVNFGAFVEIEPIGKEALLHISKIADHRVERVEDYLELGQKLEARVLEVDSSGKVSVGRIF